MSEIDDLEREILDKQGRLAELKRRQVARPVPDYELLGAGGKGVRLSELFGDKDDLILVHNMGRGCSYCTLWADGFQGVLGHLQDRAGFAVVSPDSPAVQEAFARSRGWCFTMLSDPAASSFSRDMGFRTAPHGEEGGGGDGGGGDHSDDSGRSGYLPGVSTFRRMADGSIVRVASAPFGPGDPFCSVWNLFALLAEGDAGWSPKYRYGARG